MQKKNIRNLKIMEIKSAVEVFDQWAEIGKDEGMEKGHAASVDKMFDILSDNYPNKNIDSALDVGCGNGWLVRKIGEKFPNAERFGIDGAEKMITKAKENDLTGIYSCEDINSWIPNRKFDLIMSMEVMYYLDDPEKVINTIISNGLNDDGVLIVGVDHYKENTRSLTWADDLQVNMNTLSINEWLEIYKRNGLSNITINQYGQAENWEGTLIIAGNK
tara:strand:- start:1056 stop:1709 length:654 start_codon:yes stop_codon:yes gene_type:complete